MDSGSHGSVISLRLANELGLSPDKSKARSHILADGGSIANLGEIQSLVVQILNVKIRVHPVVFEKPTYDLLLGSEAMELLGITADYGKKYFSIRSNDGIEPLIVKFNSGTHKMEKIPSASDSTDYDTFEEESYDTESPDDTDAEESYLLMFDHGPGEENFMVNNEEVMPISDAQAPDRSTHEEIMNILDQAVSKCELNGEQKEEMRKLLAKYTDVFGLDYQDLRQTNLLKLHIDTGDHAPVMKRPNRYMSHSELESLRSEIDSMLKNGQIVPATYGPNKKGVNSGGWAFPIMYVKKKNTSEKRLVVQFQDLNALTIKDPWPLPSITDLLETYEGASFFSTMDLLKGFNQIAVDDESIPKLTMATPWGCFSYKVMPFGIVNGPATFSRAIYLAMQGYLNEFISTYIDDITVYSASFGEHILHLEKILQRIREVSMVLKPNKCHFAKSEVEVLGFVVSKGGIKPHQQNVEKVINFPKPKNKTDIRAFISLAGFYRRHVQGFSEVAEPLNKLLKKSEPFKWTESQEQAFIALKECIVKATQLKFPDPHEPYKLYTDASEIGVGAVLVQYDEERGEDRPVCFLSRKLIAAELSYPTVEKELLAVIYALKKLRKYLLDKEFKIFTDNTAVRYLFCKRDPGSRLQRWVLSVQEYSFKVTHLPGKSNVVADVMSRYPPDHNNMSDYEDPLEDLYQALLNIEEQDIFEEFIMEVYLYLLHPEDQTVNKKIKERARKFVVNEKGELFRMIGTRLVKVPKKQERSAIIIQVHDGHGHFGQDATWSRLYSNYWWPNAYQETREFVASCENCQLYAYMPRKAPLIGHVPVHSLFERFAVDYVGPFPKSENGNRYIIMAVEYYTNWPIAKAVKYADGDTTVKFLYEDIFCVFGPPKYLLSDNGTHFVSNEVEEFIQYVNTKHQYATPYHPQTNGKVEHLNGTIVQGIKKLSSLNPKTWDTLLPSMLYAYRTKAHQSLGISPFEMLYGASPREPGQDVLQTLGEKFGYERLFYLQQDRLKGKDSETIAKDEQEEGYTQFSPGTQVVKINHSKKTKLDPNFKSKIYTVLAALNNNVYILANPKGIRMKRAICCRTVTDRS